MKKNILLLVCSILVCFGLLVLGEVCCRLFSNINLQGTSRTLYTADAYGNSMGNKKNFEAVAFEVNVYTDDNGFRIDPNYSDKGNHTSTVLILGDSVGFGLGVTEDKTYAGLLRKTFPDVKIYNSSVCGYSVADYKNIVDYFVLGHKEIDKVYLIYCLNDNSRKPASNINKSLKPGDNQTDLSFRFSKMSPWDAMILQLREENTIIARANYYLTANSKLYRLIRSVLLDGPLLAYRYDLLFYSNTTPDFARNMNLLSEVNSTLKEHNIEFMIFIIPEEPQLRYWDKPEFQVPQHMLTSYFDENNIKYKDTTNDFLNNLHGESSREFYLYGDPLHLSEIGHRVLFDIISNYYAK